jgi:hypothetical protein
MDDDTQVTPAEVALGEKSPESLIEALRARRQEVAETTETMMPISGYEEFGLQVKHRLLERTEVTAIGRKIIKEFKKIEDRNVHLLYDQIIASTEGFYIQVDGDPEPVPLWDQEGQTVLRWDQLAETMGATNLSTARDALIFVFGGNEFAIGQHGILLNRWFTNTGINVDEEFLGEAG